MAIDVLEDILGRGVGWRRVSCFLLDGLIFLKLTGCGEKQVHLFTCLVSRHAVHIVEVHDGRWLANRAVWDTARPSRHVFVP